MSTIENILVQHRITEKNEQKINTWIESFKHRLSQIENDDQTPQKLGPKLLKDIKCPLNERLLKDCDASFIFQSPISINAIGSYSSKCLCRDNDGKFEIDLCLEIPKSFWQKKDHLNYVYHCKRSFYLSFVAQYLSTNCNDLIVNQQFRYFNNDQQLSPYIHLIPTGKFGTHFCFNIYAVPSYGKSFLYKNFRPAKCLLQTNYDNDSTAYYNQTILNDLTALKSNEFIQNILSDHTNVRDSLILLRIWLNFRDLRQKFSHIITLFTCHLIEQNQLNINLPALQIFEIILKKFQATHWLNDTLLINFSPDDSNEEIDTEIFKKHFKLNFIDTNSGFNVCYDINEDDYKRLKIDCAQTLKILNLNNNSNLEALFTKNIDPICYFDFTISIIVDSIKVDQLKNRKFYEECGKYLNKCLIIEIQSLIKMSVGERLILIQPLQTQKQFSWNINDQPPSLETTMIHFGILMNHENFLDQIIKGPIANQKEAIDFRDLWGTKRSEIRRFQNGDIRETVVWNAQTMNERRMIVLNAIKYILNRKMNMKLSSISSNFNYLDESLMIRNLKFSNQQYVYGTGEECFDNINHTIDILKKYLHNLKNSKFQIIDVLNIDSVARRTDVFPPLSINSKSKNTSNECNMFDLNLMDDKIKYIRSIPLVVRIDSLNGEKFSRNLIKFKCQKYLLINEIAKSFYECHKDVCLRLNDAGDIEIYLNGYVFRLIVVVQKELTIYRQQQSIESSKRLKQTIYDNDQIDCERFEFKTQILPTICGALNAFQNENYSYSLTCRLIKRWLSLQMIVNFFEDITIDLLVAYFYQQSNTIYPSKNSHLSMFIRFLQFLSEFNFVTSLIILNFNNSITNERIVNIRNDFIEQRSNWPIITIISEFDRNLYSYHTRQTPDTRIVFHLQKLAKIQFETMKETLYQSFRPIRLRSLFKIKDMNMFDLIIKLNSKYLPNKYESMDFPEHIQIKHTLFDDTMDENHHHQYRSMPIVDYHPALIYFNHLQRSYANVALFFYDQYGGLEIGVLLRPEILETRPFKYSTVAGTKLSNTSTSLQTDNVEFNLEALIEDFKIMGDEIVDTIIVKNE